MNQHYTLSDVAKRLHVTPRTVQNYVYSNVIPAPDNYIKKKGVKMVWDNKTIDHWLISERIKNCAANK